MVKISKTKHVTKDGVVKKNPSNKYYKLKKSFVEDAYGEINEEQNIDSSQFFAKRTSDWDDYPYSVYVNENGKMKYFGDDLTNSGFKKAKK